MRKPQIVLSGLLCVFVSACALNTVEKITPTPIPTSDVIFLGEPLTTPLISSDTVKNSPSPSPLSTSPPSPLPTPVPTPSPKLSPTPIPYSTYPPEVVANNLSFVDWPGLQGVQFFKQTGNGIFNGIEYNQVTFDKVSVGGMEVTPNSQQVAVQFGWLNVKNSAYHFPTGTRSDQGWAGLFFHETSQTQGWEWANVSGSYVNFDNIDYRFIPRSQEDFASMVASSGSVSYQGVVDSNFGEYLSPGGGLFENGLNTTTKEVALRDGLIPNVKKISLADIDTPIFDVHDPFSESFLRSIHHQVDISMGIRVGQGLSMQQYLNRVMTIGKRAVYLILPDFTKKTLVIHALLLPNRERWVEFDIPFVRKDIVTSNSFPYMVVVRYHAPTDKLYLFCEPRVFDGVPRYDMSTPDFVRFSEDFVLQ